MWKVIFNRFMNLFKAKALSALDAAENPVEMYELAVRESEQNIQSMTKAIAVALADQKTKERELQQASLEAQAWQQKAKTALALNQEELARTALEHKGIAIKKAEEYAALNEMLKTKIEEQKKQLSRSKIKHEELKAKKSVYAAKYETAKAQKTMAESIGGLNQTALSGVSRLEEKINKMEAESEALLELTDATNGVKVQLDELEVSQQVESDLDALRDQLSSEEEVKKNKKLKQAETHFINSKPENNDKQKLLDEFYTVKKPDSNDNKKDTLKDFFKK